MILCIDNYDSFVYNLARYVNELNYSALVFRNDKITLEEIMRLKPSHIIISPGPCTPNEAGISMDVIKTFGMNTPILGVCLGHQAIGQVFGGQIIKALKPCHGKSAMISHQGVELFQNIENPCKVARYHSLIINKHTLPDTLLITAMSEEDEIMAIQHRDYPIFGVQFHPESILTEVGYQLMRNFLII